MAHCWGTPASSRTRRAFLSGAGCPLLNLLKLASATGGLAGLATLAAAAAPPYDCLNRWSILAELIQQSSKPLSGASPSPRHPLEWNAGGRALPEFERSAEPSSDHGSGWGRAGRCPVATRWVRSTPDA